MQVTKIDVPGYETVYRLDGEPSGYLALHRSRGGKSFGGLRIRSYPSDRDALDDALRLARAMSLKLASVEIPGGGGKAVLEASSLGSDRAAAIARFGEFVASLDGRYVTGPDLGVGPEDVAIIRQHTDATVDGDLSAPTALGVRQAIRGALAVALGTPEPSGRTIAIQGLGAIGAWLAALLVKDGAKVKGADVENRRVTRAAHELGLEELTPDAVLAAPVDVLSPCAIGGVVTEAVAHTLRAAVVCGGANNILAEDAVADTLHARGILFVPDFVASAGGAIQGAWTHLRGPGDYTPQVMALERRVTEMLTEARERGLAPLPVALERVDGCSADAASRR